MTAVRGKRVGHFYVDAEALMNDEEFTRLVMANCIITRCEYVWHEGAFHYHALSPHFDELKPGEAIPDYCWEITRNEPLGQLTVKAVRR